MSRALATTAFGLALAAGTGLGLWRHPPPPPAAFAPAEYRPRPDAAATPVLERGFVFQQAPTAMVHSGTLATLPGNGLLAAWFGGSREGAGDVALYAARRDGDGWSPPRVLLTRTEAERELGLHLRKLGNPVLFSEPGGRLWLFFVIASMGGWSTSAVAVTTSDDGGRHWTPARRLVSSPFLDIATLVRARPLALADGGIALPAYHELMGKFGELLRLDRHGHIRATARIGQGRSGIQPTLAAAGPRRALAWLRRVGDSPHRVLYAHSEDGGAHWSGLVPTGLPNPDASVAALRTPRGDYLLAYNPAPDERTGLALALSTDGLHWRRVATLEAGRGEEEYSYPFLVRDAAGDYQLIYTWRRRRMAWARFNDAWLEAQP